MFEGGYVLVATSWTITQHRVPVQLLSKENICSLHQQTTFKKKNISQPFGCLIFAELFSMFNPTVKRKRICTNRRWALEKSKGGSQMVTQGGENRLMTQVSTIKAKHETWNNWS